MFGRWKIAGLRLTMLREGMLAALPPSSWRSLMGTEPDSTTTQRSELRAESGVLEDVSITCTTTAIRTDWALNAHAHDLESFGALGMDVTGASFFELAERAVAAEELPVARLAFGAELLQAASTREDGYEILARYLHKLEIDRTGSSDLLYQINRSRPSKTPNMRINRVSNWVVIQRMTAMFAGDNVALSPQVMAARVVLDVNTAPESNIAKLGVPLVATWKELVELGREIAEKGDIA